MNYIIYIIPKFYYRRSISTIVFDRIRDKLGKHSSLILQFIKIANTNKKLLLKIRMIRAILVL